MKPQRRKVIGHPSNGASAGHGVHRSEIRSRIGCRYFLPFASLHLCGEPSSGTSAGHGVHRSESVFPLAWASSVVICGETRLTAGHGLHRSFFDLAAALDAIW
jgi:hypothetical protein